LAQTIKLIPCEFAKYLTYDFRCVPLAGNSRIISPQSRRERAI